MESSYNKNDVTILLKDITGLVKPQPTEERERLIQSGKHYCEMLSIEYVPSERYMSAYKEALKNYSKPTAIAIGELSDKIIKKRGKNIVLVSLARAGIPIGILLKHYITKKYNISPPHYSISIIRGRGIDNNAMRYLLNRHNPENILFVDGWIGKGAILNELKTAVKEYDGVSSQLAVISDPAYITELYGTNEDILIPSSCLNCTVSGLISRTFFSDDIIGKNDFHGAVYYKELKNSDLSYQFINSIESNFEFKTVQKLKNNKIRPKNTGLEEVEKIAKKFNISDINFIKPGIGETTRVLLRRVPWKVLINENNKNDISLNHIKSLAEEKSVPIEYFPLSNYKTCGIIKKISDL